jgi:hypothetical protein
VRCASDLIETIRFSDAVVCRGRERSCCASVGVDFLREVEVAGSQVWMRCDV